MTIATRTVASPPPCPDMNGLKLPIYLIQFNLQVPAQGAPSLPDLGKSDAMVGIFKTKASPFMSGVSVLDLRNFMTRCDFAKPNRP